MNEEVPPFDVTQLPAPPGIFTHQEVMPLTLADLPLPVAQPTRVEGRGLRSPEYQWSCSADGVSLRVDDAINLEAWVQVYITYDTLKQLVSQVEQVRELAAIYSAATQPK